MMGTLIFLLAVLFGMVVGASTYEGIIESHYGDIRSIKHECEKALPRNQHCVLIAIPEQDNE